MKIKKAILIELFHWGLCSFVCVGIFLYRARPRPERR